jgi:hypothetical protein
MASSYFLLAAFLAMVTSQAIASDPSPLQDFCVADMHSPGIYECANFYFSYVFFNANKSQITEIVIIS